MSYFEVFDIEEAFILNESDLKKRYYIKSRDFHPDHFTMATDKEKEEALAQSTLINEAFKTLSDFDKRMEYILNQNDMLKDSNNDIPQDFLMEMMDVNEELFELEMDPDTEKVKKIKAQTESIKNSIFNNIKSDIESYPTDNQDTNHNILGKVKDYYLKNKYLLRILDKITKFASA
jgi:molecular chaperone HscB